MRARTAKDLVHRQLHSLEMTGEVRDSPVDGRLAPIGRATPLHGEGSGFDPPAVHLYTDRVPYKDPEHKLAWQRQRNAERRQNWLEANGPCVDCGSWECLEVDHVDASLKVSHKVWSWREERRLAELSKCVVRCHSCHLKKTRLKGEYAHGETHGNVKLTHVDVLAIRASGESYRKLAQRYNVDHTLIYQIKKRKIWTHI
jgi:hypothetical protein